MKTPMPKPATPLPWRVVERQNARGQALTPGIVGRRYKNVARDWPIAIASAITFEDTNANAAYIVEACNAYPQLIADRAALVAMLQRAAFDENYEADDCIALLDKLGAGTDIPEGQP